MDAGVDFGPPITEDLLCAGCGESLRGRKLGGACGGCGRAVMETFVAAARGDLGEQSAVVERIRRAWLERVAEETGFSYEAVRFVTAVWPYAHAQSAAAGTNLDARALCRGFRDQLIDVYGSPEEARKQMVAWKVTSGEELGRIVFGLVKIGLLVPGEGEHVLDFSNVFTLYTLFDGVVSD